MSYKLLAARTMKSLGLLRVLEMRESKPGILIVNHHRIGVPTETCFDRDLFGATEDELEAQVQYFKRRACIVSGEELENLVTGKTPVDRLYVTFTFDDGYLDNYTKAFDIFRSSGTTATFFLVSNYVGTATVPWWDEISYRIRNTKRTDINLEYPVPLKLSLEGDREAVISTVLRHYKKADRTAAERMLEDLRQQAECDLPEPKRRFLSWSEAREMKAAGMAIGSHTRSHAILAKLSPEEQREELVESKKAIESNLGSRVRGLAYPVGAKNCFSETTEKIALDAGYSMCFSAYGGINGTVSLRQSNLLRETVPSNTEKFRAMTTVRTTL